MTSILPIVIGAVLAGWAFLTLLGGERTRRVNQCESAIAARAEAARLAAAAPAPIPTAKAISSPVSSQPAAPAKPEGKPKPAAKPRQGQGWEVTNGVMRK